MHRTIRGFLSILLLSVTILVAGCFSNPAAPKIADVVAPPDTTPGTVRPPTHAIIDDIILRKFPAKTTGGKDWDVSPIVSARRPDIYVTLGIDGQIPTFSSDVRSDATPGAAYHFRLDDLGRDLPQDIPYGKAFRIYVMDRDVGGDNDRLGWITLNLPAAFNGDSRDALHHTFKDSSDRLEIEVVGTWSYR